MAKFQNRAEKTTPVNADLFLLADSADLNTGGNPIVKKIDYEDLAAAIQLSLIHI